MKKYLFLAICALVQATFTNEGKAQAELAAWGNLYGIRIDGELMAVESSLCVVASDWSNVNRTAKERQNPRYTREGDRQTVVTTLPGFTVEKVVHDISPGVARVDVRFTAEADTSVAGAYLCLQLPGADYAGGTVELLDPAAGVAATTTLDAASGEAGTEYLRTSASGARFIAPRRQLEVAFDGPADIVVRTAGRGAPGDIDVFLGVLPGNAVEGTSAMRSFTLTASGEVDRSPVFLGIDTSQRGRRFAGLGGNFRIQNPNTDPQVIDYSLEHLRVAWGRVEMPWRLWHPEEGVDPYDAAMTDSIHPRVEAAMEMAQRLDQMGIPVMLAVWWGPDWAIVGPFRSQPQPGELRGNPLNPEKTDEIYASITSYIRYLRDRYGVETHLFSFNESDLGIDIRQTAEEHAELIKGLGAYFVEHGLDTKLLLGDTADANGWPFLEPAMNDPETHPYIGAVSFHSWRGWDDETLMRWADAAERMNVPLVVGEGSIDAAAWRYPHIFQEQTYALEEINLYTRILAITEPLTILQWQLTADYSPLAGGGIFGDQGPLRPTQRFWNLKQLASTPEDLYAMPATCPDPRISCAALGDVDRGTYAFHVVNNGATREAVLSGLPDDLAELSVYVTDRERGMEGQRRVAVSDGMVRFPLDAVSFTTLVSVP